jgi:hypothetical protein
VSRFLEVIVSLVPAVAGIPVLVAIIGWWWDERRQKRLSAQESRLLEEKFRRKYNV